VEGLDERGWPMKQLYAPALPSKLDQNVIVFG
jgi:hypothetical protein